MQQPARSSTVIWSCENNAPMFRIGIFHSLHHRKEGWPSELRKFREASADREAGVVFRFQNKRKTTPAASASVAAQNFIDDAATPPCSDARSGITRRGNSFTRSDAPGLFFCAASRRRATLQSAFSL